LFAHLADVWILDLFKNLERGFSQRDGLIAIAGRVIARPA